MSVPARAPAVVAVDGAWKRFRVPHESAHTLKERVLHPLGRRGADEFHALRDVSFDVRKGEFFGIVGRNGSGKSTILKCLAGIYGLDRGRIVVDGRMSTFIELGVGFNPDLAAYDNVVMNGIMLGLSPREARARFQRIIEFAELEDYTELKLKNYSSGMHVRLAFSVAIQVEADILLIDEVLAVGDAAFQQKCFDVFHEMRADGRTVLFVTHDMGSVTRMCDRAILLERGELVATGNPNDVATRYLELNFAREDRNGTGAGDAGAQPGAQHRRPPTMRLLEAWVEDLDGVRTSTSVQQRTYRFCANVELLEEVAEPAFTLILRDENRRDLVVATNSLEAGRGRHGAGSVLHVAVELEQVFRPGRYNTSLIGAHGDVVKRWDDVQEVVVIAPHSSGALTALPYRMSVTPVSGQAPEESAR